MITARLVQEAIPSLKRMKRKHSIIFKDLIKGTLNVDREGINAVGNVFDVNNKKGRLRRASFILRGSFVGRKRAKRKKQKRHADRGWG